MKKIRYIMNRFALIVTGQLISVSLFTNVIYKTDVIDANILWQILLTSF